MKKIITTLLTAATLALSAAPAAAAPAQTTVVSEVQSKASTTYGIVVTYFNSWASNRQSAINGCNVPGGSLISVSWLGGSTWVARCKKVTYAATPV